MKKLIEEDLNHIDEICQYGQDDELSVEELQDLRDKLANWYQVRYSDSEVEKRIEETPEFLKPDLLEQLLNVSSYILSVNNFKLLTEILSNSQKELLECDYGTYTEALSVSICYMFNNYRRNPKADIKETWISLLVQSKDISEDNPHFYVVTGRKKGCMINSPVECREIPLEDLIDGLLDKYGCNIDSDDLEELINKYDYRLELRHQLLESVALRILTSATTKKIGYFRAKMFLAEMNLSLGLNLTTDDIDDVYFAEYPEEMVVFISQMKGKVYQKKMSN